MRASTVIILGIHAELQLSPAAVDELFEATAVLEAGGTTSRLHEFFEQELRARQLAPLPEHFCWGLEANQLLTIEQTAAPA